MLFSAPSWWTVVEILITWAPATCVKYKSVLMMKSTFSVIKKNTIIGQPCMIANFVLTFPLFQKSLMSRCVMSFIHEVGRYKNIAFCFCCDASLVLALDWLLSASPASTAPTCFLSLLNLSSQPLDQLHALTCLFLCEGKTFHWTQWQHRFQQWQIHKLPQQINT